MKAIKHTYYTLGIICHIIKHNELNKTTLNKYYIVIKNYGVKATYKIISENDKNKNIDWLYKLSLDAINSWMIHIITTKFSVDNEQEAEEFLQYLNIPLKKQAKIMAKYCKTLEKLTDIISYYQYK